MTKYIGKIGSQYQLVLTVNTKSQSQTNNTSTLSYSLSVEKLSGYGYWTNVGQPYSIKINGQNVKSGSWTYDFRSYSSKTIGSGTITINHNSNGSVTVPISASVSMYSIGTGTISNNYTPAKINRGVETFIFNYGWGSVDETKNITFTKPNSNIRASLEWRYYNNKHNTWSNTRVVSENYTSQTSFKFSDEDINLMHTQNPNSKEVTIQVLLKSYNGTILSITVSRNISLKLKEEPPIINSTFEVRGQNQSLLGSSNLAVQNIHWLKILDDVKATNGATISRIEVEFEKRKQTSNNAEFRIRKSGNSTITVKAVDSRGYSSIKEIGTITVIAYTQPTLNNYKVVRLENGIENPLGNTGAVLGTINFSDITIADGTNINKAWWNISFQNTTVNSATINATKNIPIENNESFTLTYGDSFSTITIKGIIPLGQAPLVLGKQSIGINTIPPAESSGLHIGGKYNLDRAINFHNKELKQTIRTTSGYSAGNGIGFIMDFGNDKDMLFLNDGTIWTVDKSGNRIKKIAG